MEDYSDYTSFPRRRRKIVTLARGVCSRWRSIIDEPIRFNRERFWHSKLSIDCVVYRSDDDTESSNVLTQISKFNKLLQESKGCGLDIRFSCQFGVKAPLWGVYSGEELQSIDFLLARLLLNGLYLTVRYQSQITKLWLSSNAVFLCKQFVHLVSNVLVDAHRLVHLSFLHSWNPIISMVEKLQAVEHPAGLEPLLQVHNDGYQARKNSEKVGLTLVHFPALDALELPGRSWLGDAVHIPMSITSLKVDDVYNEELLYRTLYQRKELFGNVIDLTLTGGVDGFTGDSTQEALGIVDLSHFHKLSPRFTNLRKLTLTLDAVAVDHLFQISRFPSLTDMDIALSTHYRPNLDRTFTEIVSILQSGERPSYPLASLHISMLWGIDALIVVLRLLSTFSVRKFTIQEDRDHSLYKISEDLLQGLRKQLRTLSPIKVDIMTIGAYIEFSLCLFFLALLDHSRTQIVKIDAFPTAQSSISNKSNFKDSSVYRRYCQSPVRLSGVLVFMIDLPSTHTTDGNAFRHFLRSHLRQEHFVPASILYFTSPKRLEYTIRDIQPKETYRRWKGSLDVEELRLVFNVRNLFAHTTESLMSHVYELLLFVIDNTSPAFPTLRSLEVLVTIPSLTSSNESTEDQPTSDQLQARFLDLLANREKAGVEHLALQEFEVTKEDRKLSRTYAIGSGSTRTVSFKASRVSVTSTPKLVEAKGSAGTKTL